MAQIPFTKLEGTGNDFIVVDARKPSLRASGRVWASVSRAFCNRRTGIGADGMLVLEPSKKADVVMRVFNPDGSEAEMCGNGARCVALYVSQLHRGKGHPITLQTLAGGLSAKVRGNRVAIGMTDPTGLKPAFSLEVGGKPLTVGFVNTGVPHLVVSVDDLDKVEVRRLGRLLRYHDRFAPRGTNVNFIQADKGKSSPIRVRTYERGVEDETLACGTGIVAAAVVHAVRTSALDSTVVRKTIAVDVQSGDRLRVSMDLKKTGNAVRITNVVLEGKASRVFDGIAEWPHHLRHPARGRNTNGR